MYEKQTMNYWYCSAGKIVEFFSIIKKTCNHGIFKKVNGSKDGCILWNKLHPQKENTKCFLWYVELTHLYLSLCVYILERRQSVRRKSEEKMGREVNVIHIWKQSQRLRGGNKSTNKPVLWKGGQDYKE